MKKLVLKLKKDISKIITFQFRMNSDIEIKFDRLWKVFRDEFPNKSDLIRHLIDEAYKQNVEGK